MSGGKRPIIFTWKCSRGRWDEDVHFIQAVEAGLSHCSTDWPSFDAEDFYDDALAALAVEFCVEDAL